MNDLKNTFERFGKEFQTYLIKALLKDKKFFDETEDVLEANYFYSLPHSHIISIIKNYFKEFGKPITLDEIKVQITSQTKLTDSVLADECIHIIGKLEFINEAKFNPEWVKKETVNFCKNQRIRKAIEQSLHHLENDDYDEIRKIITDATKSELKKDIGHEYFKDIEKRLTDTRRPISTGYKILDAIFDGGFGSGELIVVCAGPSIGKSFFLINFAKRSMDCGRNVVYYTLEMAEALVEKRLDALNTGIYINDLNHRKEEVIKKVNEYGEKTKSQLYVKQYPTKKASVTDIHKHIVFLKRSVGFQPDLVIVDYADLLRSNYKGENKKRFELENLYEELRGLAVELDIPLITASQSNKEGAQADVITMANLAESYSKAAISDIVLGITRRASGNNKNYGNLYIAKNRGFGRDGITIPIIYETAVARIDLPYDEDVISKIEKGNVINFASQYYKKHSLLNDSENMGPENNSNALNNALNKVNNELKGNRGFGLE